MAASARFMNLENPFLAEDLQALGERALVARPLLGDRFVIPLEETALGLEADAALVDVALQDGRRAGRVAEVGPNDLGHRAGGVPAGMLLLHARTGSGVAEADR